MKNPVVTPFLALAAGIVLSRLATFPVRDFLWATILLAGLALLAWWISSRMVWTCGALMLAFTGGLLEALHRAGPPPSLDAGVRETVILDGCVVSPPAFYQGRDQFVLELAPGARARVGLNVRAGEPPPDLRYGQIVEIEGRVRRIRNFHNPGAFDYEAFSARSHIYWTVSTSAGSPVAIQPGRCGSRILAAVFALRTGALQRIEQLYAGNPYATAMMEATLIGESTRMQRIWTDRFRRTGTYHMLVIDGLHITILAAFLLFLLRLCAIPEMSALAITASGAWLYALVSGWNAPAIRAAGGFTLYVIARYFYRRGPFAESAFRDRHRLPALGSRPAFRSGFPVVVSRRRRHRAVREARFRRHVRALFPRAHRNQRIEAAIRACRPAALNSAWNCGCWPRR